MKRRRFLQTAGITGVSRFGKTDLQVSRLGFGSHLVQELIRKPKLRDSMIKRGFDGGINVFDVYDHSNYNQFEPMGKTVQDIGRKDVVISLVVVNPTETIQQEIDGALRSFRTDYIDLYRHHIVNDERMDILVRNRAAGKIRHIGVVSHNRDDMMRYLDDYGDVLDYVMIIYNFYHNMGRFAEPERYPANDYSALLPRCEKMGLGVIGIKPMGSDDMTKLARERGFFNNSEPSITNAMLRHVFSRPEIDMTMTAMNGMAELAGNLGAAYTPTLQPEDQNLLERLGREVASTNRAYLRPHYRWLDDWAGRMA